MVVPLPRLTDQMVAALAAQFPEPHLLLDWSEKEVWFRAGQVSVVRWLASKLEEQEEGDFVLEVG